MFFHVLILFVFFSEEKLSVFSSFLLIFVFLLIFSVPFLLLLFLNTKKTTFLHCFIFHFDHFFDLAFCVHLFSLSLFLFVFNISFFCLFFRFYVLFTLTPTRALAKKLGLRFLDMADGGMNVDVADGGTNENDWWWQLTAFNKRLQLSRCVSSFSFNMWQTVHYKDIDICTLTPSLPCRCLPCCLFFSPSACPQTDTAQLYNTHPDSCTHMDRTGLWVSFCLCENKSNSHCHPDNIHGSGAASPLRLPTLRYCERLWPPNLWMQSCSRTWEAWASRRRLMETMQSTKTFDSASEYTWASSVLFLTRWWTDAKTSEIRSPWQPWERWAMHIWSAACRCIVHWPW